MDDVLKEFLVESNDNLDNLDQEFLELEKNPTDKDRIAAIFRSVHTIKGTCGFLGFAKLESVTHVGENLLSKLRDGVLLLIPEITSALLALVDATREIIKNIESTGSEGDKDYSVLIDTLARLQKGETNVGASTQSTSDAAEAEKAPASAEVAHEVVTAAQPPVELEQAEQIPVVSEPAPQAVPEIKVEPEVQKTVEVAPPTPMKPPVSVAAPVAEAPKETKAASITEASIRVDVKLLDDLMNLVGELVLTRNQILQYSNKQEDSTFITTTQRLNIITSELQESMMKTRMQPIGNVWSKFPRVVRDLAGLCKKKISVVMEGQETELDKTLLEAIKDPLTHLIRNSVDHGIETPQERIEKGKPEEGLLKLRAYHEGGQVNIEIIDNGGGINPDKVKEKAIQKGLVTPEEATKLSERQITNMIFMPGFSTAEKVSNISGRGVGMDVVKTNIEKIGGMVDIQSKFGEGTTIKIKIPLTLAIIPALLATSGGDLYAIPQVSLLELVRLEAENAAKKIEMIHGSPVYRLRGKLLPLVDLNKELNVGEEIIGSNRAVNIVVLQADDRQFGLLVDDINDTQEIVVKPLSSQIQSVPVFAGSTIMGDGRVALILDVMGVAQKAHVVSELKDKARHDLTIIHEEQSGERQSLLLFSCQDSGRMAIPLSQVSRLEKFSMSQIEKVGTQEVVQYRGDIMSLIRVSSTLSERRKNMRNPEFVKEANSNNFIQVVVYKSDKAHVGLVIDRILDIVEASNQIQRTASRNGIMGSLVIQGCVTEILDIEGLIQIGNIQDNGQKNEEGMAATGLVSEASLMQ